MEPNPEKFLGKDITVVIDRPLGSKHPEFGFAYEVNYRYIPGTKMPDGEELDAYCLEWDTPLKTARGRVVAVVHRSNDDDDKLVVAAPGKVFSEKNIERSILFQEKYFKHIIVL